jgi:hypothetical protein
VGVIVKAGVRVSKGMGVSDGTNVWDGARVSVDVSNGPAGVHAVNMLNKRIIFIIDLIFLPPANYTNKTISLKRPQRT